MEFHIDSIDGKTASKDEVAACLAAICLVTQAAPADNRASERPVSAWRRAMLLESTGRKNFRLSSFSKESLWRNRLGLFLALSSAITMCSSQVSAQDVPAQQIVLRPPMQSTAPPVVRVLLSSKRTDVQLDLPDGGVLRNGDTGELLAELPAQSSWKLAWRAADGYPRLSFSGALGNAKDSRVMLAQRDLYRDVAYAPNLPNFDSNPMQAAATPNFWLPAARDGQTTPVTFVITANQQPTLQDAVVGVGGKMYRGKVIVKMNPTSGFDVLNALELEDYLQSVVPSEMPSGWPIEALKAQAIAARSYAVANIGKHEVDGYDVKAGTEDQVYCGVSSESVATNRAVAETAGAILCHQGKPISAFFHSSSGGCTEVAENVWDRPVPYLNAVADFDDESPHFAWNRQCPIGTAEAALERSGKGVGNLLALMPISRGASSRVRYLLATGTQKSVLISGEEARQLFGLPSASFNVGAGNDSYVFAGRGFGHGLGMSQWGAKRLAEAGHSAQRILNYYYKDVTIERL